MAGISYSTLAQPHEQPNEELPATVPTQAILDQAAAIAGTAGDHAAAAQAAAQDAAAQAASASSAAASAAEQLATVQAEGASQIAAVQAVVDPVANAVGDAAAAASSAQAASDAAASATATAYLWANAPEGQPVDPATGEESALSQRRKAERLVVSTALQPVFYVTDPVTGTGSFDVTPDSTWLGRKVVFRQTRPCRLVLPPNLNRAAWPDGSDALAYIRGKRRAGAGTVTIAAGGSAIITPRVLIDDIAKERFAAGPAGTTARTRSIPVAAGTGRMLVAMIFALYDVTDAARSTALAASLRDPAALVGSGSAQTVTKLAGPIATATYNVATGAQQTATLFVAPLADSATDQMLDVTTTFPKGVFLYWHWCCVSVATPGYNAGSVAFSEAASSGVNFADLSLTSARANSIAVFGFAGRQAGSFPIALSRGTVMQTGQGPPDPGANVAKDGSYAFGYELVPAAGSNTWRATYGSTSRHAGLGVLLEPGAATSAVALDSTFDLTAGVPAGGEFLVEAYTDGLRYDVSA